MKRLLLLHGYTEDRTIFDPLLPLLPPFEEVVALELAEEFAAWHPAGKVNVVSLARHLAARYHIGPADVLIGHSMGGWIVAHIKEQTGATAILLSSFTDQAKIVSSIRSPRLLGFYAHLGLVQNRWLNNYFKRRYPHDESRALHAQLIAGMGRFRRDTVVRPPDEPFVELPGDHFAHYFYPQLAAEAIRQLLVEKRT
jgi:pimeloyl-ACP methyl ester carboxylesterase